MAKAKLTRSATLLMGAIVGAISPMLAADAKLDVGDLLDDVTAKNIGSNKQKIFDGLVSRTKGKLAKDAKIEGPLKIALDAAEANMKDAEDEFPDKDDEDEKKKTAKDADPEKKPDVAKDEDKDEDKKKAMDAKLANMVTKDDMSNGIKVAVDAANKTQREIREAERFVRPWVGELAMDAATCASDVYAEALKVLSVKTDGIHPSAFRTILEMQPKAGQRREPVIGQDAAPADSFMTMFPDAARLIQ